MAQEVSFARGSETCASPRFPPLTRTAGGLVHTRLPSHFYFLPQIPMGNMKELYTALHEMENQMREHDPTGFENATRVMELLLGPIERPEDVE